MAVFQLDGEGFAVATSNVFLHEDAVQYLPGADLNHALSTSPLAVNSVPIPGYNVTAPFNSSSSSSPIDGWSLTLTSAVDVSAANTTNSSAIAPGDFADVVSLYLTPPLSLYYTTTADSDDDEDDDGLRAWRAPPEALDTWRFSATVFWDMPDEWYAAGRGDDGTCAQTVPPGCIEWAKSLPAAAEGGGDADQCEGAMVTHISSSRFDNDTLNYAYWGMGSTGHGEGEVLAFSDEAVVDGAALGVRGRTIAVVIAWTGAADADDDYVPDAIKGTYSVACLNVESEASMAQVDYTVDQDSGATRTVLSKEGIMAGKGMLAAVALAAVFIIAGGL